MKQKLLNTLTGGVLRMLTLLALVITLGASAYATTDVLTNASLNNGKNTNSQGYNPFTSGEFDSGAQYAGKVNFQLNKGVYSFAINENAKNNKGSDLVTVKSGGVAKSVKITWCTQPTTANDRVVNIYGQNKAYASDDKAQGTLIGSCKKGTNASEIITLENQTFQYIAINAPSVVNISTIEIEWSTPAAPEKVTLTEANLVVKDENESVLNNNGTYDYAAPTKISFAYIGETGVANADITYSYSVDGGATVEGNEYTYAADKDVTLTVNATSSNTVSKTINLSKIYPTECPLPEISVNNDGEVQVGQTVTVSCEGAETLTWSVNGTPIEGYSYKITEAVGTELTFHAIASVAGKTETLSAENTVRVTVVEPTSVTFNFAEDDYGLTPKTGTDYETEVDKISSGIVTINFTGTTYRLWSNDRTLRVQSGSTFTISVPTDYYITSITMTGTSASPVDTGTFQSGEWTPTNGTTASSVKFSPTSTTKIKTITVNYAKATLAVPELDGVEMTNGKITGEELKFVAVDGVSVWYKIENKVVENAPMRETNADGYTKYEAPVALNANMKSVSFYAENDATGAKSEVKTLDIDVTTGIAGIEAEAGEAVYYNLQGVRVENPVKGLYIRVANGKSQKVIM